MHAYFPVFLIFRKCIVILATSYLSNNFCRDFQTGIKSKLTGLCLFVNLLAYLCMISIKLCGRKLKLLALFVGMYGLSGKSK